MAVLIFPIVGAVAGGLITGGTALGIAAGAAIGGLVGLAMTRPDGVQNVSGARLGSNKVQVSMQGATIPIVEGKGRTAGNVFWATDIVTHVHYTTQGGKGGEPEITTTSFSYTVSFAVLFCESPGGNPILGFERLFINGELKFDRRATSNPSGVLASINARLFLGGEDQEPSALMEAHEGAGNVPGYRDVAHVEFENMATTSNNLPNIEAVLVSTGDETVLVPQEFLTLPDGVEFYDDGLGHPEFSARATPSAQWVWCVLADGGGDPRILALLNLFSEEFELTLTFDGDLRLAGVAPDGSAWVSQEGGSDPGLRRVSVYGETQSYVFGVGDGEPARYWDIVEDGSGYAFASYNSTFLSTQDIRQLVLLEGDFSFVEVDTERSLNYFLTNAARISGRFYVASTRDGPDPGLGRLGYVNAVSGAYTAITNYNRDDQLPQGIVGATHLFVRSANTGEANVIEKRTHDGAFVDSVALTGWGATTYGGSLGFSLTDDGAYLFVQLDASIWKIATGAMTIELVNNAAAGTDELFVNGSNFQGAGTLVTLIGTDDSMLKLVPPDPLLSSGNVPLSDVVTRWVTRTALTESDLDVTDIEDIIVSGVVITAPSSIRDALNVLRAAFFFDGVESEGKLKFRKRTHASVVTIPEDDLGARVGDTPSDDPVRVVRQETLSLPKRVHITYLSIEADYQPGKQSSKRRSTLSEQEITIALPIALHDETAMQIAEATMYEAYAGQELIEFETTEAYFAYEPTDVITVPIGEDLVPVRILSKGQDLSGVLSWQGVRSVPEVYTQVAPGASTGSSQTITPDAPASPLFLDEHLLRDVDNVPGFYFAARGLSSNYRGQQLYVSKDVGVTYTEVANGSTGGSPYVGSSLYALDAPPDDRTGLVDYANVLTVRMFGGAILESFTEDQIEAGVATAYLLGHEILYIINTSEISAGTWECTGLYRGRGGTEPYMEHAAGDRFVVLNLALISVVQASADINIARHYKSVAVGSTQDGTPARIFTSTSRRLMPLSPVQLRAGKDASGNIVFDWRRRTRFQNVMRDKVGAPLDEPSERYFVYILSGSDVVRTEIVNDATTFTYTAAMQTTDFGGELDGVTFEVRQYSFVVGVGYPAQRSVSFTEAATHWRFTGFEITGVTQMQIGDIAVYQDGVDITSTYSAVTASDAPTGGSLAGLFDGILGIFNRAVWTPLPAGLWVELEWASPVHLDQIQLGNYNASASEYPTQVDVEVSYDSGATWKLAGRIPIAFVGSSTFGPIQDIGF